MKWVTLTKFCELSGFTKQAVYAYVKKGVWLENQHYRKTPNQRIVIDPKAVDAWIEGKAA